MSGSPCDVIIVPCSSLVRNALVILGTANSSYAINDIVTNNCIERCICFIPAEWQLSVIEV